MAMQIKRICFIISFGRKFVKALSFNVRKETLQNNELSI